GAAGQIPERLEAYRCWIRLHYVDMIKKCAAPSFASGRTAMTIDSNMFGFWNDVAGKPASGKIAFAPPLHAPSATSLESDIWIWALAMNAASEKKGTAWLFIPWATSKQVALKGA
ncbi:MAG: extracellular solute-binding protein, partial [Mesorhizobium sp.]